MEIYGLKNMASPCKGCKERWVNETGTCHTNCERYIAFKEEARAINARINDERHRTMRNPIAEGKTASQLNRMRRDRKK